MIFGDLFLEIFCSFIWRSCCEKNKESFDRCRFYVDAVFLQKLEICKQNSNTRGCLDLAVQVQDFSIHRLTGNTAAAPKASCCENERNTGIINLL